MTEVKIAIGEPKWPNDKDRAIGVEFSHRHPETYKMVRKAVKEKHFEYVSEIVERAKFLPINVKRVRFAEYITRLTYSEIKQFVPMAWSEVEKYVEQFWPGKVA